MKKSDLIISAILKDSWSIFRKNIVKLILGWLLASLIIAGISGYEKYFESIVDNIEIVNSNVGIFYSIISGFMSFLYLFVSIWMIGGILLFFTKAAKGEELFFRDIFVFDKRLLHLFATCMIMAIGIILGLCLFFVPGIILFLMWSQAIFLVMDKKMNVIEALKTSTKMMKGNKIRLGILYLLVQVIGTIMILLTCCIGCFFVAPWTYLVIAYAYVILSSSFLHELQPC